MSVLTPDFLTHLTDNTANDSWEELLAPFRSVSAPPVSLHLAVLVQPYLDFILDGQKTIESRFSIRPIPPYRRVESGDIVLLKASGGPIVGAFTASAAWFYRLDPESWSELRRDYAAALCAQDGFWESRSAAEYATLVRVSKVQRLTPASVPKRDRRGWVILAERHQPDRLV